jgi:hypothetical protein
MKLRLIATVIFAWTCAAVAPAAAPIDVELATQQGLQITAPQEWLQLFAAIGMDNVRIRGAEAGDKPLATNRGTAQRPRYYVLGILTARNQLQLPGGTFGRGDRARIKDYFDRLAADGAESLSAPRGRYGLTEQELAAVFADLTQPIDFETKGQLPPAVIDRLQGKLALKFAVDTDADAVLRAAETFSDELQGVAAGTGAAILLRSYGLVMRPEKSRGRPVAYRVAVANANSLSQSTIGKESDKNPTNWPIGWEPDTAPVKIAPSLFEQLNAEIDGYTLAETLAAVSPRVKVPLYIDHAVLAANKIDPSAIKVKLPRTRTTYNHVLVRVIAQARLGSRLRVDEAGRPFVWITR